MTLTTAGLDSGGHVTPFFIAGTLKCVYDVGLYLLFRNVRLSDHPAGSAPVNV